MNLGSLTPDVTYIGSGQINIYYGEDPMPGSYSVYVDTQAGGYSGPATFTVNGDPTPSISNVSPSQPWTAGTSFTFNIYGSGFGSPPSGSPPWYGASSQVSFSCCIDSYYVTSYSDGEIDGYVTVDQNGAGQTTTITVASSGYNGLGFQGNQGASNGGTYPVQLGGAPPTLTQAPSTISMSIGDPNKTITVSSSPSNITFTPQFSSTLLSNQYSNCQANLTVAGQQGTGTATSNVTAANPTQGLSAENSCSGVFNVAAYSPAQASSATIINVPPQAILIQMFSETNGAYPNNATPEESVSSAALNMMTQGLGPTTWQALITARGPQLIADSGQPTNGLQPELDRAVATFTGGVGDIVGGSPCYWSPTNAQWALIQSAQSSQDVGYVSGIGDPQCFYSWGAGGGSQTQVVIKTSMPNNLVPGKQNAPAFVFERRRSPGDLFVVQVN